MWLATLILLGIIVVLALWGLDEKSKLEQLEARQRDKKSS